MSDAVRYEAQENIGIIHLDDGKANALSPDMLAAIDSALDQAEESGAGVVIHGRPERFTAGFDLGVMREGGPKAAQAMVTSGARLALRIARFRAPVVIASTGHALAMGAVLLAAADTRIGAQGAYKIGYNEVAIGMTTPVFLVELARQRMPNTEFLRALVQSHIYDPEGARIAGLYDEVHPPGEVLARACDEANRLAQLPRGAYVATRKLVRGAGLDHIEATLEDDMAKAFPAS